MEEDILNYSCFMGHPVYSHKISRINGIVILYIFRVLTRYNMIYSGILKIFA